MAEYLRMSHGVEAVLRHTTVLTCSRLWLSDWCILVSMPIP